MKLLQKILERSRGLHYRQEYLCLDAQRFDGSLRMYRSDAGRVGPELTRAHLFVGYCPVVLALPEGLAAGGFLHVLLSAEPLPEGSPVPRRPLACLQLRCFARKEGIAYFEAERGAHRFLSPLQQALMDRHNEWYQRKAGNVFLEGNRYRQVQIAYALPRTVSLITVGDAGRCNVFPTDLHGPSGDTYIVSLRQGGKACAQVEAAGRIHLSNMPPGAFRTVYALGKNHMQPMKEAAAFPLGPLCSAEWGLPLPEGVVDGYELELTGSTDAGIHRLLRFRIRSHCSYVREGGLLAHVHAVYATWRHKNGGAGNYLFR